MYARAEQYRRRAIEARQRAGQTKDDAIQRSNFELIAESWIELAEQVEWEWKEDGDQKPPTSKSIRLTGGE